MRSLILLLLAACASGNQPMRVLVYNIHAGRDAKAVDNLERVAALIKAVDADLVLLQEVDRGTTRSGGVDQLAVLERLTGLRGTFGKSLDYQGGEYGVATLSRWPVTAHKIVPLRVEPPQPRAGGAIEPRVALVVDTGRVRVLNTHLDASREEIYRLQEVAQVLDTIAKDRVMLAGGDFNAEPGSAVQQRLAGAGLRDCGAAAGPTFPADKPVKRIDYLFLREGHCGVAKVLDSQASDHRPVLFTVQ